VLLLGFPEAVKRSTVQYCSAFGLARLFLLVRRHPKQLVILHKHLLYKHGRVTDLHDYLSNMALSNRLNKVFFAMWLSLVYLSKVFECHLPHFLMVSSFDKRGWVARALGKAGRKEWQE
jgi:hypothetical protein